MNDFNSVPLPPQETHVRRQVSEEKLLVYFYYFINWCKSCVHVVVAVFFFFYFLHYSSVIRRHYNIAAEKCAINSIFFLFIDVSQWYGTPDLECGVAV